MFEKKKKTFLFRETLLLFSVYLRQYRTILIAQMRRQIFRQTNPKDAGEMDFRQGILVQYDGKDASSCVIKTTAANCAVLP